MAERGANDKDKFGSAVIYIGKVFCVIASIRSSCVKSIGVESHQLLAMPSIGWGQLVYLLEVSKHWSVYSP